MSEWSSEVAEEAYDAIMGNKQGAAPHPLEMYGSNDRNVDKLRTMVAGHLGLPQASDEKLADLLRSLTEAALGAGNSSKLRAAREMIGFTQRSDDEIAQVGREAKHPHLTEGVLKQGYRATILRRYLAWLEDGEGTFHKDNARRRQKKEWVPAMATALHTLIAEDRNTALRIAAEVGLVSADEIGSASGSGVPADDGAPVQVAAVSPAEKTASQVDADLQPSTVSIPPEIADQKSINLDRGSHPRRLRLLALAGVLVLVGVATVVVWKSVTKRQATSTVLVQSVTDFTSSQEDRYMAFPGVVAMTESQRTTFEGFLGQSAEFDQWYEGNKGAVVASGFTNVTLQGTGEESVRIVDMDVVKSCDEPLSGTVLRGHTEGGGERTIQIGFNLDHPKPIPQIMASGRSGLEESNINYFSYKTVVVAPGETLTLSIGAFTKKSSCSFTFELLLSASGGLVTQTIDQGDGKPFTVTALAEPKSDDHPYSGYEAAYVQDEHLVWNKVDPTAFK